MEETAGDTPLDQDSWTGKDSSAEAGPRGSGTGGALQILQYIQQAVGVHASKILLGTSSHTICIYVINVLLPNIQLQLLPQTVQALTDARPSIKSQLLRIMPTYCIQACRGHTHV